MFFWKPNNPFRMESALKLLCSVVDYKIMIIIHQNIMLHVIIMPLLTIFSVCGLASLLQWRLCIDFVCIPFLCMIVLLLILVRRWSKTVGVILFMLLYRHNISKYTTTLNSLCWQRIAIAKIITFIDDVKQFRVIIVVYWSQLSLLLIHLHIQLIMLTKKSYCQNYNLQTSQYINTHEFYSWAVVSSQLCYRDAVILAQC